jgi:hypothetical protein
MPGLQLRSLVESYDSLALTKLASSA